MSEVIVVTSGKGGVGKTTVAANLGCGLALLGNKVVLIDTDIGLRNLDVVMGLENRIVYNLVDVVGRLSDKAGADQRQKSSGPVSDAVGTNERQIECDAAADEKADAGIDRGV